MLGAAEADPLRAELARLGGVLGRVRVRAHLQAARLVGPAEDRLEVLVDLRRDEVDRAEDDSSRAAVDRDHVVFAELVATDRSLLRRVVDREPLAPRDARLAHPARDDGRVRGHPAMGGQDSLCGDHPVDVVGGRLPADEDHVLAGSGSLGGRVRVEHDLPGRRARRCVQALRHDLQLRSRVDHRVEQLVELTGIDADDRVLARDQVLSDHVHGGLQRGRGRPLGASRLEQVEAPVLDRELDVLHVAVVLLQAAHRVHQLVERLGQRLLHGRHRLRCPDPGDDVLALRVGQELAVQAGLAGRRVTRERHARARLGALVAEDHLHDVDGGAEVVGDVVRAPVDLRAGVLPGLEDRAHGA